MLRGLTAAERETHDRPDRADPIHLRQHRQPSGAPARPLRELHRDVLRRFLATGAPPTAWWVRQAAAETGLDASAVDELAAADAVHMVNGVVAVAYALGLPAMADRNGRITSAER
jgi:hypothetical protein